MKKIIIIALTVLTVGFVSSCSKDNSVKPSVKASSSKLNDSGTLGTGDGTPPGDSGTLGTGDGTPPAGN